MRFLVCLLYKALIDKLFDFLDAVAHSDLAIVVKREDLFTVLVVLSCVRLRSWGGHVWSLPCLVLVEYSLLHAKL